MDKTYRREQYPLLGEPKLMFEGDNVYVVNESAEIGKTYSFICPRCHTHFISSTMTDEVNKIKCPDCDTYICYSTKGKEGIPSRMRTQVILKNPIATPTGILVWIEDSKACKYPLRPGIVTIGRKDRDEPSDISVNDATASRQSVKIEVTKGEKTGRHIFKLTVMRTTNAVYVNHNALYSKSSIYLNYGDTIKVGETVFTLMAEEK